MACLMLSPLSFVSIYFIFLPNSLLLIYLADMLQSAKQQFFINLVSKSKVCRRKQIDSVEKNKI